MATTDVNTPVSNPQPRTRIRHHCIVTKLMEVNASLSDQCKKLLRTTPFGWLLNLHCNIEASGRMLEVMLATWNADERALIKMGDKLIPFTLYDVALILGLPVTGESIDCSKSYGVRLVETLLVTHFKTAWPTRTKLVTLLTKPSTKVPNRVRLYMTLILTYFLFPTTNKKVSPNLLALLDDIPQVR
jgi:hypothetical protein